MTSQIKQRGKSAGSFQKTVAAAVAGVSACAVMNSHALIPALLYATAIGGILFCATIVLYTLGTNSAIARRFCPVDARTSCNKVLEYGIFRKHITWADLGLMYFTFQLLYLWLSAATNVLASSIPLLYIPGFLCLLVTFGLVIYQGVYIGQWCRLCLCITVIVCCQAVLLVLHAASGVYHPPQGGAPTLLIVSCAVLTAGWLVIKPFVIKTRENAALRQDLTRFRQTPEIFVAFLTQQRVVQPLRASDGAILLGDPEASYHLLAILNPYCKACAAEFFRLKKLFVKLPTTICLNIYFHVPGWNQNRREIRTAQYLIDAYMAAVDTATQMSLLTDWLCKRNLRRWIDKWGHSHPSVAGQILERHESWCREYQIVGTPALFLNGFEFPKPYRIADLHYLLQQNAILPVLRPTKLPSNFSL